MAAVINTNYLSLVAQNNLNKSQSDLGSAIERLSSGLRINSAKDDAAGEAIANRFTANVNGLTQAARNANDGISIAQTTEGALDEINNNLQRIRELSVQAANGTNSGSDLDSIQAEITQRLDEITRVANQTQFNGVKVLASDQSLSIQVGANDSETINIDLHAINANTLGLGQLDISHQMTSVNGNGQSNFAALGTSLVTGSGGLASTYTVTTVNVMTTVNSGTTTVNKYAFENFSFDASGGATAGDFTLHVSNNGTLFATAGATQYHATLNSSGTGHTVSIGTVVTVAYATSSVTDYNSGTTDGLISLSSLQDDIRVDGVAGQSLFQVTSGAGTNYWVKGDDGNFYAASVNGTTGEVSFNLATSVDAATFGGFVGATVSAQAVAHVTGTTTYYTATTQVVLSSHTAHINTQASTAVYIDQTSLNTALGGGTNTLVRYTPNATGSDAATNTAALYVQHTENGVTSYYKVSGVNGTTGEVSVASTATVVDPLNAIDKALAQVDDLRSALGAIQNRFESTVSNLNNTVNNLSASRSRIEDADYATEVSNMTRAQILQQAGTSVLAQANQVPQSVLSLLR